MERRGPLQLQGDALSLILLSRPEHGTLTPNADNSLDYQPLAHWGGEDGFRCRLLAGHEGAQIDSASGRLTWDRPQPGR